MARRSRSTEIETVLLEAVAIHPHDLVGIVAAQLGLSTARIGMQARALVADGYLEKSGSTRPTYALGRNRRLQRSFPRSGLAEDTVWSVHLSPLLRRVPLNVLEIAHHGATEMINNAIDHSGAKHVTMRMDLRDGRLLLSVSDDGVGIFRKIAQALNLPDERLALLELSKGKFTTDPKNHPGVGVFFISRMFDNFQITSGALDFDHDDGRGDERLFNHADAPAEGTIVYMAIDISSQRTVREVIASYSSGPDDYTFARTVVPVRLAQVDDENLVSRSQAKRLLQRVDRFRHVVLNFDSVRSIGQAFADEIFRVFALEHPETELIVIHALPDVQQMIRRAEVARDESNGQMSLI